MRIITKISEMKGYAHKAKKNGKVIGFVPTMGSLHDGHVSLIKASQKESDITIVSIFVNPKQFGKGEDLKKYPRNLARDLLILKKEKIDVVFIPAEKEMYPEGYSTYVNVEGAITENLCARSRPGHFKGVATVVAKLFGIVSPCVSFFGQKDAQQAVVIKHMVKDLNMCVEIRVMPIIREKDGLAMSSRNTYLSEKERKEALAIYASLKHARTLLEKGERSAHVIKGEIKKVLLSGKHVKIDHIEVVDAENLKPLKKVKNDTLIAIAVHVGKTRLIDNMVIRT
ncbi:MAG: pantoate--beta-alanine ligase [Candidatus Omnitrophica bacterium]|nr:pantoate--beta-alanine ligase [Candidatus Omnitrophota bacterium]